jgi:hypothetical protein
MAGPVRACDSPGFPHPESAGRSGRARQGRAHQVGGCVVIRGAVHLEQFVGGICLCLVQTTYTVSVTLVRTGLVAFSAFRFGSVFLLRPK